MHCTMLLKHRMSEENFLELSVLLATHIDVVFKMSFIKYLCDCDNSNLYARFMIFKGCY